MSTAEPGSSPSPSAPAARRAPSYGGGHWLAGHLYEMRRDPLAALGAIARAGDVVEVRFLWAYVPCLFGPDALRHVLQDNYKNYGKETPAYRVIRELIGRGLVTSEGDLWLRQRRIAQPAFHRQRIAGFADIMVREAEAALSRMRPFIGADQSIDIAKEMTRITLAVVGETLLGGDTGPLADEAGRRFVEAAEIVMRRSMRVWNSPLWLPSAENRRFNEAAAALDAMVYRLIAERRAAGGDRDDLLSMFLQARDEETGERMSDRQLRDEVMTMFLAGHETTAVTLSWTFHLLANHPEAAARLRAELREVLGGRSPRLADCEKLRYTRMVIDEALRLYPPVWGGSRNVLNDDILPGGYRVKRGAMVMYSPYVTHRLPRLWDDPDAFRPERWETDKVRNLPKFAYFPFLGGPRVCIGNQFALMEAQLVLATLFQGMDVEPDPAHPVVMETSMTLRPKHGVHLYLRNPPAAGDGAAAKN